MGSTGKILFFLFGLLGCSLGQNNTTAGAITAAPQTQTTAGLILQENSTVTPETFTSIAVTPQTQSPAFPAVVVGLRIAVQTLLPLSVDQSQLLLNQVEDLFPPDLRQQIMMTVRSVQKMPSV